jgi:hypothetical protein
MMAKISWTYHMKSEEVLHKFKEEKNILHTVKGRQANWIGHMLHRNCLLKYVIEGKTEGRTEVQERQGRRWKQLQDYVQETRGYLKLKEEGLNHTLW